MMTIGDHIKTKDPLIEDDTLMEVEDPLIEEDALMEVEDPLIEDDTLVENPLMEVKDPLIEEEDHLEPPRTRTIRPSRTTWACEANNCTNSSGNFGHLSTRKYI